MKFDENLVAIHAYLCADGCVVKNLKTQKHKYYRVELRNTNVILLKDFQNRFEKVFEVKPYIYKQERCRIGSKEIYQKLINRFGSFYSWEWQMPKLSNKLSRVWLRSFFDCEGWVFCKTHQNRHIGLDSINEEGISQIINSLNKLGIKTIKKQNKKRRIHRIFIYGKENLIRFKEKIGFLHPEKSKKLSETIKDYVRYKWDFPRYEKKCQKFIRDILKRKIRIRKPYYVRIISKEKKNLDVLSKLLKKFYSIDCLVYNRINGIGTLYYELNINRKVDVQKLINLNLMQNIFKLKNN